MWVVRTPAMSAATADTCDSSVYQPASIGSRDSANAETARATKSSTSVAAQPPSLAITRAPGRSESGSNSWRAPMKRSTRGRRSPSKNRASAVASIEVKTRNGLRSNSTASIGRNAVDTTGTAEAASRRS